MMGFDFAQLRLRLHIRSRRHAAVGFDARTPTFNRVHGHR
jgi:hypothetical protein